MWSGARALSPATSATGAALFSGSIGRWTGKRRRLYRIGRRGPQLAADDGAQRRAAGDDWRRAHRRHVVAALERLLPYIGLLRPGSGALFDRLRRGSSRDILVCPHAGPLGGGAAAGRQSARAALYHSGLSGGPWQRALYLSLAFRPRRGLSDRHLADLHRRCLQRWVTRARADDRQPGDWLLWRAGSLP